MRLLMSRSGLLGLAGVLLPNLPYMAAWAADVAVPPRTWAIGLYLMVACLAVRLRLSLILPAFVLVALYDAAATVSLMFHQTILELISALRFAAHINLHSDPNYVTLAIAALLSMGLTAAALVRLHKSAEPSRTNRTPVLAMGLVLMSGDLMWTRSVDIFYGNLLYSEDGAAAGATKTSGWLEATTSGKPHKALLVVVESYGQFVDPARREGLAAALTTPAVLDLYDVTRGTVASWGSTTAAEMRELCQTRMAYDDVAASANPGCIPELLRRQGFATTAIHAYSQEMFDRFQWYPRIGFDRQLFAETLGGGVCGSIWNGRCDNELAKTASNLLSGGGEQRQFVYWLTLNTHVPVDISPFPQCRGDLVEAQICTSEILWRQVLEGVAAAAIANPGTEILVVGDHPPPIWSRKGRKQFEPGIVPWFRLAPKSPPA